MCNTVAYLVSDKVHEMHILDQQSAVIWGNNTFTSPDVWKHTYTGKINELYLYSVLLKRFILLFMIGKLKLIVKLLCRLSAHEMKKEFPFFTFKMQRSNTLGIKRYISDIFIATEANLE